MTAQIAVSWGSAGLPQLAGPRGEVIFPYTGAALTAVFAGSARNSSAGLAAWARGGWKPLDKTLFQV